MSRLIPGLSLGSNNNGGQVSVGQRSAEDDQMDTNKRVREI